MSKTEVYLVGDDKSPETNQWLAMTNSTVERDRLMVELGGVTTKVVQVGPPPRRRPRK